MQNLLISACLIGAECKYSGGSNRLDDEVLARLKKQFNLFPVCPEVSGGLPTPRKPSEQRNGKVYSSENEDVTEQFVKGARTAAKLSKKYNCSMALMKQSSPSCGSKTIYDGSFSHTLIEGEGVAVKELRKEGVRVMSEKEVNEILEPTLEQILAMCDHTLLSVDCTSAQIKELCDQAIKYHCASVCIPPCHVAGAKRYVGDKLTICTVIGFPNGYMTKEAKAFEAADAIKNGADEVDMVINISMVKDGAWDDVKADIMAVRNASKGKLLKVIIECCLLTKEEIVKMCQIVTECGAEYIKTSTGFSKGGATFEDVELMRANCPKSVKVKAAGGIKSIEDAKKFVQLGAERLGTSRIVKIAIAQENEKNN